MVRIEKIIPDDLLESLQIYLQAAADAHHRFIPDSRGYGRRCIYNDPLMVMVQKRLLPTVEMGFKIPLRRSYCFTIIYDEKGILPKHTDRPECEYSLDVCIDDTAPTTPWKLYVEGQGYILRPGEGLMYYGCKQVHWREGSPRPGQEVTMALFHFVDKNLNLRQ